MIRTFCEIRFGCQRSILVLAEHVAETINIGILTGSGMANERRKRCGDRVFCGEQSVSVLFNVPGFDLLSEHEITEDDQEEREAITPGRRNKPEQFSEG